MKRLFDVAVSLLAIVVLSPLFGLITLAVKVTSAGPVFYRGERIGRGGSSFRILKFRTMRAGASGPAVTRGGDARVTPTGRILRRSKLDELPQLVNVLRGDMTIVGPRPEAPEFVSLYTDDERRVLTVRPGVTSPASLRYRREESLLGGDDWHDRYVNEIMRDKLRDDLHYIETRTFLGDLRLIVRTFASLFRP
ncbi:MAG TPA: sugar transferase [Thermoanaerobaculia bacterium]|nr:sugar transferase [Thermoanaerobaculia bacterium]